MKYMLIVKGIITSYNLFHMVTSNIIKPKIN